MDLADAVDRLASMTDATGTPGLTDTELETLLSMHLRTDGTWNIFRAAAEGWRWKAGRVSGGFSFSADGVSVDKTMLIRHMLQMAQAYDREATRSRSVYAIPLVKVFP